MTRVRQLELLRVACALNALGAKGEPVVVQTALAYRHHRAVCDAIVEHRPQRGHVRCHCSLDMRPAQHYGLQRRERDGFSTRGRTLLGRHCCHRSLDLGTVRVGQKLERASRMDTNS